jgi:kinesin family protein 5
MRAKAIKNKAKVNAELSPAELKSQLRKAQTQLTSFENYISSLEGEVTLWRAGESVPKDKWIPPLAADNAMGSKAATREPRPSTPSRLTAESRSETPAISERAGTPSLPLEKDEREEFLRRENELQDQLTEKESLASTAQNQLRELKEELVFLKEHDSKTGKENERLTSDVNDFKMQLERLNFESKEVQITMDALKEANSELTAELDEVKKQLVDVKMSAKETGAVLDEKEKRKAEKMAKMMAGFDLGGDVFSDNERSIADAILQLDSLMEQSTMGDPIPPDELKELRSKLVETQGIVRQAELTVYGASTNDTESRRRQELEERLDALQTEYEGLLQRNLGDADVEEVKARLENAFSNRRDAQIQLADELKVDIAQKASENTRMKTLIEDLQRQVKAGTAAPMTNGKTIQQQIAEFDVMKKSLMRDLQNRCERVVELEISLDETREQYNNVLRTSNNRAQQKKMAFLERNLEQLTQVQRQLVEQNSALKKEVAIAERKLIARNERIQSLESLLQDSQEKMAAASHKYAPAEPLSLVSEANNPQIRGPTRRRQGPSGGCQGWKHSRPKLPGGPRWIHLCQYR